MRGHTVATTTSGPDGEFTLQIPRGSYTLVVLTHTFPRCPTTPVLVPPRDTTHLSIVCDTGIR